MLNFLRDKIFLNKELRSYILGFFFSLVLTVIPFLLVMKHIFLNYITFFLILLCAISQIIIHFFYFLHLDFSSEKRWNCITLLFILIIIFIIVFGSIWIMYNLNHHMIIH